VPFTGGCLLRSEESVSLLALVSPGGWQRLDLAVVTRKSVNSAFAKNEAELSVLVLAELLQVLSDLHSLFDQVVEVLGDGGGEAGLLQDSEDFASRDALHLGNSVRIPHGHTNLGGSGSFTGQLHNLVNNVVGGDAHPGGSSLSVREASAGNTFALRVHTAHCFFVYYLIIIIAETQPLSYKHPFPPSSSILNKSTLQ